MASVEADWDESYSMTAISNDRRRSSSIPSVYGENDEPQSRPMLPPRPPLPPPSDLITLPTSSKSSPLLQRKPVVPLRGSRLSLDKRSYTPVQAVEESSEPSLPISTVGKSVYQPLKASTLPDEGHLPPKAFYKTHYFFRWDLGYWRQPARHSSIFAILFLWIFIPFFYSQSGFESIAGSSKIQPFGYDCLESTGWSFVGTNLRYGRYSFGQAKAIDLAWNWVVGRGYQGLLTLLTLRVFSDALLRCAEITALPFELYATLALPPSKIELLYTVGKNLFRYGNWRVKFIFVWMIISTMYLIAVPGLMDAATAYEVNLHTHFSWPDGKTELTYPLLEFDSRSDFTFVKPVPICLSFTTKDRKGIPPFYGSSKALTRYYDETAERWNFTYSVTPDRADEKAQQAFGLCNNSTYEQRDVLHEFTSSFKLWYWEDKSINETWWKKFEEKDPLQALDPWRWSNWTFYPTDKKNFRCVAEADVYQWGFSFEWLFLIIVLNSVFLVGTWILWIDCDTNSALCHARRRLGVWRAIADLGEAVRAELGSDICAYSEEELSKVLRKRRPVKYVMTRGDENKSGEKRLAHLGLSNRVEEEGETGERRRFRIEWGREYGAKKED